jgi:hypothetical protein
MRFVRTCAFVLFVAALGFVAAPVNADPPPPPPPEYPEQTAPVYLIISFDDTFIVSGPKPSQTIVVNVGSLEGGEDVAQTQFLVNEELSQIELPEGRRAPTFEDLQDNSATVLGSFQTNDLGVHMVTPESGSIPSDIQEAVFVASNGAHIDALLQGDNFPTTEEIAEVIAEHLPAGSPYTLQDVLGYVFNSGQPLFAGDFGASMVGEGDMFPHPDNSDHMFHYVVKVFEDGDVSTDVCGWVGIDVVPGDDDNEIVKAGEFPVALLTTSLFDATGVDPDSATIGGIGPVRDAVFDADDDGDDDMVVYWRAKTLFDAGVLSNSSTSLTVRADLADGGGCVIGSAAITVK